MATAYQKLAQNFGAKIIKAAGIRIGDDGEATNITDVWILSGTGAPAGAYMLPNTTDVALYVREDAPSIDAAFYVTVNSGTGWTPFVQLATSYADNVPLEIGSSADLSIVHDGTNTTATSAVGDLIFDNTDVNDQIIFRVGTDTAATGFEFRNNSDASMFGLTGAGVLTFVGSNIDLDPTGTFDLAMDNGQALSIDIDGAASNITLTADGAAQDLTIALAGAVDSSLVLSSTGTGADALQVTASAGGLVLASANTTAGWAHTANGAADDLTIAVAGAVDSSLVLSSAGTGADALQVTASAGGMDISAAGDLDIVGTTTADFGDGTGAVHYDGAGALSLTGTTTVDIDGSGAIGVESSAGAINIGADAVAQAINIGTGAAARVITIGNAASASLALEGGVGPVTVLCDTTMDLDSGTALSLNSAGGAINIGNDAVAQALNLGTGAAARVITIGNAASASLSMDGGVGAVLIDADTTVELNSSAGAIYIGNDAVAQPIEIGNAAAARAIVIGNAASASLAMDAGVGAWSAQADTTVGLTAGTILTLSGARVDLGSTARLQGFNALSPRYELNWVAGSDGLVQLNASSAFSADKFFEILGTNASNDDVTYSAEGGLVMETDGADADSVILLPHLVAGLSPWTATTWGTDKQTMWECDITTGASIVDNITYAGLKLTNTDVVVTDADQVFFRYEEGVAAGNFQFIDSIGGADTATDTGVVVAPSTRYHLKIVIASDRTAKAYVNGTLVHTTAALTNATDLIPYIGVVCQAGGASGAKSVIVHGQSISRTIG